MLKYPTKNDVKNVFVQVFAENFRNAKKRWKVKRINMIMKKISSII